MNNMYYLAAAGVGTVGIIDADVVEESNLQRQIIHNTSRIGKYKAESARESIEALNPDVKVVTFVERLDETNVRSIIANYDVIIDGTDNFPTRYLLNDAALLARKPVVHGSVLRFEGQITVFKPYDGPCYRCLYPEPPLLQAVLRLEYWACCQVLSACYKRQRLSNSCLVSVIH